MSRLRSFLTASAFCIFMSACLGGNVFAQAANVILFSGRDATGQQQEVPPGTYAVSGKQISSGSGADAGMSVRVPKDHMVRFCSEKGSGDGGGNCEEFGEGTHNVVSLGFNFIKIWKVAAKPAVVPAAAITVFEQANWGGRSQAFGPGMYRSFRGEFGRINDNMAMSVIVLPGFEARFCADEGISFRGSGDCEVHGEGRHNLRFANSISFIEVKDLSDKSPDDDKMPVVLYEDPSQGGIMQGFDVGEFAASRGQFGKIGNDRASSISVKSGYKATVCSDEDGGGTNCEEFGQGKRNLKSKKAASLIKVVKADK